MTGNSNYEKKDVISLWMDRILMKIFLQKFYIFTKIYNQKIIHYRKHNDEIARLNFLLLYGKNNSGKTEHLGIPCHSR